MVNIARLRADTPGCEGQVFLDSAGSSLPPRIVVDTAIAHLRREAEIGGYRAANERLDDLSGVKTAIGQLINAPAEAIALSDSASRSWSDFFYAVPLRPGDRILISGADYASNAIAALQRARQTGAVVETIPSDSSGQLDLDALQTMVDERVKLVSLVHVPTNGGLVNPVAEAARIARRAGALVLLDACQSAGQLPLDITELGVDALSATGRKWLRGPRGTGFLYVRPELAASMEPSRLDLHSAAWTGPAEYALAPDAGRFEFWECDIAGRLGLGAAIRYLLDQGPADIYEAIAERAEYLRKSLQEIPRVTVRDRGTQHAGIVSFTVEGRTPIEVRDRLARDRITVTVSHRSSTLLDMTDRDLDSVVRASPHAFITFEDLDRFTEAVTAL
ncbi:aminotransferase class V-fold PLP-dependent enzyme [Nocardia sp. SYP-A9097]|uniref:aminotransferase class V-fold PLP-dependent enzyme n=1 Tax=Nocardia sp. SYP-A9097 TaxID=2663237 RepID=UPI00129C0A94|nr:aminotransferase class V-fold PLP-dependent enzyme [Nocardia sp. SYP-A9097]MRH86808.1 aminotransferase class V-fold PLP-dependent enzyme [Nocardia sp. SYP-A9097]